MKLRTFATFGIAALAAGCVANNTSVQWYAICSPPADTTCPFSGSCGTQYVGQVAFDPAAGSGVELFIEMHNQRPNNADPTVGRLNTNNAYVQQYAISYGGVALAGVTVASAATVPASGSTVVPVPVVSGATAATAFAALADGTTAVAHVVASGKYGDGSSFETAAYDIPIMKCTGCTAQVCPTGTAFVGYCPGTTGAGQLPAAIVCQ